MADAWLIAIDLERVAANLTAAGDPTDAEGVAAWLAKHGIRRRPDGWWACEEIQLGLFGAGEIIERRRHS